MSANGKPVFNQAGDFLGYRGTATDETATIEAQRQAEVAEAALRRVFETSQDLILVTDRKGALVRVSPSAMTILGYHPDEMVGRRAVEFLYPDDLDSTRNEMRVVRRAGMLQSFECRYVHKEGHLVTLWWKGVWSASERQFFFFGRDITERQETERRLRESEEQLRRAQRLAQMGSNSRDLRTGAIEWSDETYRIFGVSRETFVPTQANILSMIHPDDRATVLASMGQATQGRTRDPFEYRLVRPDGAVRHIYRESEIVTGDKGNPHYAVGILRDVTERHRAEDRIRLLQGVSLAIAEAQDFETALSDVLRLTCEAAGWAFAEAWIPDALGTRLVLASVWHSARPDLDALAARARQTPTERGVGIVGRVWETGEGLWATGDTLARVANPARVEAMQTHGIKSVYAVPIRSGAGVLAIIAFVMFEAREQDQILVETISAVAAQLGAALHRKRIEASLRQNAQLLEAALEAAQLGSWVSEVTSADQSDERLEWSRGVFRIFGLREDEFDNKVSTFWNMVHPEDRPTLVEARRRSFERGEAYDVDHRIIRRDGTVRWVHQRGGVQRDPTGAPIAMLGVMQDVTETRIVDEQLRQAQKMEAIGNLTGGMAHDFNNLLGIIVGNLDLAREHIGNDSELHELVGEALEAAWRGADLTRRLLAFARRQPLQPAQIDINKLVSNTLRLLHRLLGEDIEVSLKPGEDLWPVMADPAQLEASLANLFNNARDAMPRGGQLTITTANRHLDAEDAAMRADVTPGDYAMVEVRDTGSGMSAEVMSQIFEPFFTTKAPDKGTGLGLSMVFGFLKQSNGHVSVHSEPGAGSTFRLFLPRATREASASEVREPSAVARSGGETVLVVEDNPAVRRIVLRQLRELGYRVLECDRAAAALELLQYEPVDLLFSDIVMPGGLDGVELARMAAERWPALKIVLTSGFSQARIGGNGEFLGNLRLLSKPYRKAELAAIVRAALDR